MTNNIKLDRSLKLPGVVLFGLAYMTPMIVFGTFGVLSTVTSAAVPATYIVALFAMIFTANSYGQMAKLHPVAGSAYSYASRTFGSGVGFMVGWSILLDYLFLPMVIWLIGGAYLSEAFPQTPAWFWIIAYIALTTIINIIGLSLAKKVNFFLMLLQISIIVVFLGLAITYLTSQGQLELAEFSLISPLQGQDSSVSLVLAGAAIACYSFLGFDAASTLTEETHNPRQTMPKAILLITLIGGLIFIVCSYVLQLAFPHNTFDNPDAAAAYMAGVVGGGVFKTVFLVGIILAQFASGLAAQASGSRLLYVMGRDGVIPKSIFARLHGQYRTPFISIAFTGALGLIALKMDIATSTSFINFGAFLAFFFVNLSVLVHFYVNNKKSTDRSFGKHMLGPIIGCTSSLLLLFNLDGQAITLGMCWFFVGALYLAYITRGFRQAAPQMAYDNADVS